MKMIAYAIITVTVFFNIVQFTVLVDNEELIIQYDYAVQHLGTVSNAKDQYIEGASHELEYAMEWRAEVESKFPGQLPPPPLKETK